MGSVRDSTAESAFAAARMSAARAGDALILNISGDWTLGSRPPSAADLEKEIDREPRPGRVEIDARELGRWDSTILTSLVELARFCQSKHIELEKGGLPEGVQRLFNLATAVPERGARAPAARPPFLALLGDKALAAWGGFLNTLEFVGEVAAGFARMLAGRARFRMADLWLIMQESGSQALPIVSLISFLVGLILAFVGAIQLKLFGAQIYVADLVGIAMVRAMGGIMAGIIMAGRTGASFAAQIGTMQVNEEIDALKTAGIPPIDFLVLPRVLALSIMMPLLTIYADLMGVLGGMFVGVVGLELSPTEFYIELKKAVPLVNLWIGLFSGFVFGILVSLTGCLRGIQCGRSASAVGDATRSAVVTGIVAIVVATAIITVVCSILGI